jgi:hypothetical protein
MMTKADSRATKEFKKRSSEVPRTEITMNNEGQELSFN